MKMKEIKTKTLEINKGLYFPEDFAKLPEGTFIYISKGIFLNIDGEEEEEEEELKKEPKKKKEYFYYNKKIVKELINIWDSPKSSREERKNLIIKKYPEINLTTFLFKINKLARRYNIKRKRGFTRFDRELTLKLLRVYCNAPPREGEKQLIKLFPGLKYKSFVTRKSLLIKKYNIKPEEYLNYGKNENERNKDQDSEDK
jgi:hypothetical protein